MSSQKGDTGLSSGCKWLIGTLIALVSASVALLGYLHSINNPSYPKLYHAYTGTAVNLVRQQSAAFHLFNVAENTNTGDFTANESSVNPGTSVTCSGQVSGTVGQDGKVKFQIQQQYDPARQCDALIAVFTGQLDSSQVITGNWNGPNGGNGSFTLSPEQLP